MIHRRGVIGALALGFGLSFVHAQASTPKWGTIPKSALAYRDRPLGDKSCATCAHFLRAATPGGADHCSVVAGVVRPEAYCVAWQDRNPSNGC